MSGLIDKILRYPWEVCREGQIDNVVDRRILGELEQAGFDPVYKRKPQQRETMQALALPTVMYMLRTNTFRQFREENPWEVFLTAQERQTVLQAYHLVPDAHLCLYQLMSHPSQLAAMGAYMAATYAFSTKGVPYMCSLDEIMHEINQSGYFDETGALTEINNTGFLIVTNPTGALRGLKTSAGSLYSLFLRRFELRKMTVFLDVAREPVQSALVKQKIFGRDIISRMLETTEVARTILAELLTGDSTYIAVQGAHPQQLERLNECRFPITL